MAKRLQKVISSIVANEQSGYIKGRYIGNNVRLLSDIIDLSEKEDIPGALLTLDFEKAFDSLEWEFMLETLKLFNFGPNFIHWIKVLYKNAYLTIKNNGWLSRKVYMSRGIHQGCPISALIFILAVEILAIKIRSAANVKGINIGDSVYKILQYADDSTLTLADYESIINSIIIINEFSALAGIKLNTDKTEGLWLGPLRQNGPNQFYNIKFSNVPIKCLGHIGHDSSLCYKLNWNKKLNFLENLIDRWKVHNLSIFGKVLVVNTLAVPILVYNFTVLHVPENIIVNLQKKRFCVA